MVGKTTKETIFFSYLKKIHILPIPKGALLFLNSIIKLFIKSVSLFPVNIYLFELVGYNILFFFFFNIQARNPMTSDHLAVKEI